MLRWKQLALVFSFLFLLPALAPAMEQGEPAPDFKLPTLEGETVRLSDYRGRIILLKLATTWCPTCKQQSEAIEDAEAYLKEKNVAVLEVFLQDSESMVRKYREKNTVNPDFVTLLDDGSVRKAYNVYLIPRVLFIDQEFKVRRDGSIMSAKQLILEVDKMADVGDSE